MEVENFSGEESLDAALRFHGSSGPSCSDKPNLRALMDVNFNVTIKTGTFSLRQLTSALLSDDDFGTGRRQKMNVTATGTASQHILAPRGTFQLTTSLHLSCLGTQDSL